MSNISILIPARHRPNNLEACLRTIFETAKSPDLLEIRIAVDLDDTLSLNTIPLIIKDLGRKNIFIHSRSRGNNYTRDYINWLLQFCRSKYLMVSTDKGNFKTKDWDINTYNRLENYLKDKPDRIVYGLTECGEKENSKMTYFPILSKETVEVLGFFFDYRFPKTGADWDLPHTFHEFGRIVDLRDICTIYNHNDDIMINKYEQLGLDPMPNLEDYKAKAGKYRYDNIYKLNNYLNRRNNGF